MANQIVWFDLPAIELDRAVRFYSAVLGVQVKKEQHGGTDIGVLPHADTDVAGCIVVDHGGKPSQDGPLLYFNCQGRLDAAIAAVEQNGGKIVTAKQQIGRYGSRAVVLDSAGNRIALHST
jgi:uncharacterized protein